VSPKRSGETSYAYQVERSKFDQILLDRARRKSVDVREQHTVTDTITNDDRILGLSYKDATEKSGEIRAKYVVDASGNKQQESHIPGIPERSVSIPSSSAVSRFLVTSRAASECLQTPATSSPAPSATCRIAAASTSSSILYVEKIVERVDAIYKTLAVQL
jgi:hypothetical protein